MYHNLIINKQNRRKVEYKSKFPSCSTSPRTENYFILFLIRMDRNLNLFFNNTELGHAVQMPFRTFHSVPRSSNMNRYHNQLGAWWSRLPHCSNINTSDYFLWEFLTDHIYGNQIHYYNDLQSDISSYRKQRYRCFWGRYCKFSLRVYALLVKWAWICWSCSEVTSGSVVDTGITGKPWCKYLWFYFCKTIV